MNDAQPTVLVHLASGIGNIVLATPLLVSLNQMGFIIDLLMQADYSQTADLLSDWSVLRSIYTEPAKRTLSEYDFVIAAVPPFYWRRFARLYRGLSNLVGRPPDALFYQDEQEYYLTFARALGYSRQGGPFYRLPIAPSEEFGVTCRTLAIAPGSKGGEMAAKRWPYFTQLAESFEDVVVVGTADDLRQVGGTPLLFPPHVRLLINRLTLRQTAELLAGAGAVVGNDSGLSHIAAAIGVPTLMIFGPTPDRTLGRFPPNVKVIRAGLPCEPCWFAERFKACACRIDCLNQIDVKTIEQELRVLLGCSANDHH
jgi:ADP-heptose:LPS heptosyltransferase